MGLRFMTLTVCASLALPSWPGPDELRAESLVARDAGFVPLAVLDCLYDRLRPEALERCLAAIHEFVAYVRANEPGTLRYEVWQERDAPTRFVHLFVFRDAEADRIHSESAEVKKFAAVLYPECLAPVEFIDYQQVVSNGEA